MSYDTSDFHVALHTAHKLADVYRYALCAHCLLFAFSHFCPHTSFFLSPSYRSLRAVAVVFLVCLFSYRFILCTDVSRSESRLHDLQDGRLEKCKKLGDKVSEYCSSYFQHRVNIVQ